MAFPQVLKLVFPGDTRRVRVAKLSDLTLAHVCEHLHRVATRGGTECNCEAVWDSTVWSLPKSMRLTYVDDEGDTIRVATEADMAEAVAMAGENEQKYLRLTVEGTGLCRAAQPVVRTRAAKEDSTEVGEGGGASPAVLVPHKSALVVVLEGEPEPERKVGREVAQRELVHTDATMVKPVPKPAEVDRSMYIARSLGDALATRVSASQAVVQKTFRLRNEGGVQWPAGTRLVHVGGDRMGAPEAGVAVSRAMPGEAVSVRVTFMPTGTKVGEQRTTEWRLWAPTPGATDGSGFRFGYRVWLDVHVVEGNVGNSGAGLVRLC